MDDLTIETNASASELDGTENPAPVKKQFVTPEISVPVDVLEATTFFQLNTSGQTN